MLNAEMNPKLQHYFRIQQSAFRIS
jgi:hypothetical protein